eukprot:8312143-Pyramimonas_sp.AAC.1
MSRPTSLAPCGRGGDTRPDPAEGHSVRGPDGSSLHWGPELARRSAMEIVLLRRVGPDDGAADHIPTNAV